jgi:hypothetical protein
MQFPSGFSSDCLRAITDEQIKAHEDIEGIGILENKKMLSKKCLKTVYGLC